MVYTVLTILAVVASILLVGIVLIQRSKGGGLSENLSQANNLTSVKSATDIVEKITWGLVIFVAVCCIASAAFLQTTAPEAQSEVSAPVAPTLPTNNQPNVETPAQQAPAQAPAAPAE